MAVLGFDNLPRSPGVYIFRDIKNQVLYVGKAISLKDRVSSYFQNSVDLGPKTRALVGKIVKIDHIDVSSELEALLLESELIKRWRPPYNISLKDDKFYQYIKVQKPIQNPSTVPVVISENTDLSIFPGVCTVRRPDLNDKTAFYFGPFPDGTTVQYVLRTLRRIFRFRDSSLKKVNLKTRLGRSILFGNSSFFNKAGQAVISPADYNLSLRRLVRFLKSGQKDPIIRDLKRQMAIFSRNQHYEAAAAVRDQIERFEYITQNFKPAREFLANPNLIADSREESQQVLCGLLGVVPHRGLRIEGYDISHFAGKQMVGSMVVFVDGEAKKGEYRRFKIKNVVGVDDVAALKEVLERRFKNNWPQPQVLMVDGGKPQVTAARKVLKETGLLDQIKLIGLAKRLEEIIDTDGSVIRLPRDSKALLLLQGLRDEAHRFANAYRKKLT